MERIVAEIVQGPKGAELLVAGNCNADQSELDGNERGKTIVDAMVKKGLENMTAYLLPYHLP